MNCLKFFNDKRKNVYKRIQHEFSYITELELKNIFLHKCIKVCIDGLISLKILHGLFIYNC